MDQKGNVLGKYPKSRRGIEFLRKNIKQVIEERGLKRMLLRLEPTGHYWRKFAYNSMKMGYEVKLIRTTALKNQRELDESSRISVIFEMP